MQLSRDLKGDIDDDNRGGRMAEAIGGGLEPGGHDGAFGALVEAVSKTVDHVQNFDGAIGLDRKSVV